MYVCLYVRVCMHAYIHCIIRGFTNKQYTQIYRNKRFNIDLMDCCNSIRIRELLAHRSSVNIQLTEAFRVESVLPHRFSR